MILYVLYRIGVFLALALPLKITYRVASAIADMYCRISAKDRDAVAGNLRVVLGDTVDGKKLEDMSREVFKNFAKYLVDFFRFTEIDEKYIKRLVKIEGVEHIKSALAKGKGVIMLSAHIGNWELGGAALSLSGYPINAVVLTHQNKKINDFFTRQRLKGKMRPIEMGASLKDCYRVLKGNGLLALMGDRDFTKNGLAIKFFGKTTLLPKGPAVFGYREGAAIVPTFMVRQPDDSFRLFMEPPIFADRGEDESRAVTELANRYVRVMEAYIRQYPTQWYVFRELWECDGKRSMRPDTVI
jgi:KDO2-lipid IV(A) lauroyltransferase